MPIRYVPPGARGSRDGRDRSRSPMDIDHEGRRPRSSGRPSYRDYDRPSSREDDVYRRRLREEQVRLH